jgi:hypothetical protein
MATIRRIKKRSGAKGGAFGITSTVIEIPQTAIQKEIRKPLDRMVKNLNRKGPGIVREAMKQALEEEPASGLKAYAGHITASNFPGELRPLGTTRAGTGINFQFSQDTFTFSINVLSRSLQDKFGRDGFYTFRTLTIGRESFSMGPRDTAFVFRTNKKKYASKNKQATGDNIYQNKVEKNRRNNDIAFRKFTGGAHIVPAVAARSKWLEKAEERARVLLEKEIKKSV